MAFLRTEALLVSIIFVLLYNFGLVTSYGLRLQEQPFVTETTGTPGGFAGTCAACRAVCNCACVRRTCTDTSCCGQEGFAPGTSLASARYKQGIIDDSWFRFLLSLQQKWRNHVKHAQWSLF
ncbi:uncharacterized protein LOC134693775 [Mytilus trossulus]|uniref:uncharacterized protein LOC134693775 n=1 Tax=Mytilus trossulus TaxID=6551 RepID=UPI003006B2CF